MPASSFCASRLRDATRRMSATELVCAAPSQQRSVAAPSQQAAALQPSTQLVAFVASLLELEVLLPRGGTRRHLEGGRERRAASAPSQQQKLRRSSRSRRRQCPATRVPRPCEQSTGRKTSSGCPSKDFPPGHTYICLLFELIFLKSSGHSPEP